MNLFEGIHQSSNHDSKTKEEVPVTQSQCGTNELLYSMLSFNNLFDFDILFLIILLDFKPTRKFQKYLRNIF